jgi:hypothetical protein
MRRWWFFEWILVCCMLHPMVSLELLDQRRRQSSFRTRTCTTQNPRWADKNKRFAEITLRILPLQRSSRTSPIDFFNRNLHRRRLILRDDLRGKSVVSRNPPTTNSQKCRTIFRNPSSFGGDRAIFGPSFIANLTSI